MVCHYVRLGLIAMRKIFVLISLLGTLVLCGCVSNIDEADNLSDHRPMIYVNDSIYYETADVLLEIPSKAEIIGSILEKVSQNKPMVNENFYSNCLPVGSAIYYDKDAPDIIYAKIDSDGTTKYSVYEKAIDN